MYVRSKQIEGIKAEKQEKYKIRKQKREKYTTREKMAHIKVTDLSLNVSMIVLIGKDYMHQ